MAGSQQFTTLLGAATEKAVSDGGDVVAGMSLKEFFEHVPPDTDIESSSQQCLQRHGSDGIVFFFPDPIRIYCSKCQGPRHYSPTEESTWWNRSSNKAEKQTKSFFVVFRCRDCQETYKRYSVYAHGSNDGKIILSKYGERPRFGVRVGQKTFEMLRPDSELLNRALQAESAGLGIGAYVYYRRILERQKVRIFERVIGAAKKLGADAKEIGDLQAGMDERQFTRAIEKLSGGPLRAIYMDGHNPLTLLYDEISEGVHAGDDSENLQSAARIRIVLTHLAETLDTILAERKEVEEAVHAMLKSQRDRRSAKGP